MPGSRIGRSILLLLLPCLAWGLPPRTGPDVLFLNSYHPGLFWSDRVQEGVRASIVAHERMAVEYLDSKNYEGPDGDSLVAALLSHKYAQRQPRMILSSDDYALRLLFTWRDSLFPGVPVVFCGINNFNPAMLEGKKGYTGVSEWNQMARTIGMIPTLLPGTTDLWLVTEASATGTPNRLRLDSLRHRFPSGPRWHFLDSAGPLSWAELEAVVGRLKTGDVVYWSEMYRDRNGLYIDPATDVAALIRGAGVPFLSHQEHFVEVGALGGICNRGFEHGRHAGHLMRQVLSGVDPEDVPIEEDSSIAPVFHWDAMRRFGVSEDALPEGAIVLGRPVPVWRTHPHQTLAALAALLVLGAMAAGLAIALGRIRRSRRLLRQSEAALRRSEEELRHLFDTIADAVIVHSTEGKVEYINAGGCSMYGITPADIPNLEVATLSSPASLRDHDVGAILDRVGGGRGEVFPWRARRPNTGEEFDAEVSLTPLAIQGRTRIVAVVRDISERAEAQRILARSRDELEGLVQERTADLTQIIQELEAFSYSVSHDLRTPLRGINGFAHALEEELWNAMNPEQRGYLARIRAGAVRMGETIDDLLRLSRISTMPLRRQKIDMEALVRDSIATGLPKGSPVSWDLAPLPPADADPAMMKLVWSQLLSNAVKFSAGSPHPRIRIGCDTTGPSVTWWISDNGVGFDADRTHHLFRPFRRLHHPEDFPGSGIGLAIVHRVVTRHGGTITAEGRSGEGATFRFSLG